MDPRNRRLTNAWKSHRRKIARAAFPLPDDDLAALFDAVDAGLEAAGCDHSLRITLERLNNAGHDTDKVVTWLEDNGGFCDCEVVLNARHRWEENLSDEEP